MRASVTSNKTSIFQVPARAKRFGQDDAGSLTIFTLFLFVLILMISGMAVDLIRHENERVALQNSVDTAIVAASSLTQDGKTEAETIALVKEYVEKSGFDPDMVDVDPEFDVIGGNTVSRTVTATVNFQMDTMFMNMMGIDTLNGNIDGAAREGNQLLEIALVLDVSGSMGSNQKLENLQTAAKDFVTQVINANGADRVSISIVPYNQQVYMDDALFSRLSMTNDIVDINQTGTPHAGEVTTYQTMNQSARCARFRTNDFQTRRLAATATVEASAMFSRNNMNMGSPSGNNIWCGENYPRMMLYENRVNLLHDHIDALSASGWTAIDYGLNWGVGILDPSFEPIISNMAQNNLIPASMETHPVAYTNPDVLKYVVLMTDGINTNHFDLKDEFKAGPTRIWHSETLANGNEYEGFLVEMPDNAAGQRWYVPNAPFDTSDDTFMHQNDLPADAIQWTYHDLYDRFSVPDAANYFFGNSGDQTAFDAHDNAITDSGGWGTADTRVNNICDAAKLNDSIEIYTVAFEAPPAAEALLAGCASESGNHFDVAGTNISAAFSAIATQISALRLTQ